MLFDALVLPGVDAGADDLLAAHGQVLEFVVNQYRHGKTILAIGASSRRLLDKAGIEATLPDGVGDDPGLVLADGAAIDGA